MKKIINIIAIIFTLMFKSCEYEPDPNNPLIGKNTEERMLLCLEERYPKHDFSVVKDYEQYEDGWYAVCADEQGREFKVDDLIYNNMYHFGCYDEYLLMILQQQDFINKAAEIAEENGYKFEYDDENEHVSVLVDVESEPADIEKITQMAYDIITCVDEVPEMVIAGETSFSTGEVNYYTLSKMMGVFIKFTTSEDSFITQNYTIFNDRNLPREELQDMIQEDYNEAVDWLKAVEEKQNEN